MSVIITNTLFLTRDYILCMYYASEAFCSIQRKLDISGSPKVTSQECFQDVNLRYNLK